MVPTTPSRLERISRQRASLPCSRPQSLAQLLSRAQDPLDLPLTPHTFCRYKDYREPPWSEHKYDISKDFWAVLAARLAFVIVFQVCVGRGHLSLESGGRALGKCRQEGELNMAGGGYLHMSSGTLRRTLNELNLSNDQESIRGQAREGGIVRAVGSIEPTCRKKRPLCPCLSPSVSVPGAKQVQTGCSGSQITPDPGSSPTMG